MYEENSLVGKVLNERYEILEVVGSGGMATVYKAECKLLNRFVAVKVLKDSLRYDLDLKEKFNKEAQAAAKLSHNNIVSIFDVGEIEGLNYIVMEYIDGITLKEYITENKPINWMIARNIAIQIGLALEHAHANGIIHRDIKPHNILITKDNIIKVADFGIASAVTSETLVAGKEEMPMGSVHYISPEQARGGFVNETTDIYSLGVIMYEMVTGQLPFDGNNPVAIAIMKIEKEAVNCKVINLDIPHDMAEVIMHAILKDSSARFQTAQEFLVALKRLGKQAGTSVLINRAKTEESKDSTSVSETFRSEPEIEEKPDIKRKKKEKSASGKVILSTVIGMIIVVVLVVGASLGYVSCNRGQEVAIPDVVGLTLQEAKARATDNGFRIDEENIEYDFSDEYEVGEIISQDPTEPKKYKKNDDKVIKVVICVDELEVPDIVGMTVEEAEIEVGKYGFIIEEEEEEVSDDVKPGEIIRQTPEEGEVVKDGGEIINDEKLKKEKVIKVVVCKDKDAKEMELNLVGMSKEDAIEELKDSDYAYSIEEVEDEEAEIGEVVRQEPEYGKAIMDGDEVVIYVCKGKPEEERGEIPDIRGMSKEKAKKKLEDAGFKLGNVEEKESEKTEGEVISQSPAAKSESPKGTRVNIAVSKGKEEPEPEEPEVTEPEVTEPEQPVTDPTTDPAEKPATEPVDKPVTEPKPQVKTIQIPLPQDGSDEITVKVVANGKEIHNEKHNKSEQRVDIKVEAKGDASVQIYFDGTLVDDKIVEFN